MANYMYAYDKSQSTPKMFIRIDVGFDWRVTDGQMQTTAQSLGVKWEDVGFCDVTGKIYKTGQPYPNTRGICCHAYGYNGKKLDLATFKNARNAVAKYFSIGFPDENFTHKDVKFEYNIHQDRVRVVLRGEPQKIWFDSIEELVKNHQ